MGVDIDTYRGRIGTFGHGCGLDVSTTEIVIDFTRSLKYIGTVMFIGILLLIAGVESNPGPNDEVDGRRQNDGEVPSNRITKNMSLETKLVKITRLPHNTSEQFLKTVCQDTGGGKVLKVSINKTTMTSIVQFEEICAAQRFLDSQPIVLKKTEVEVMPYIDETLRRIKVTNIPKEEDAEDILTHIFENVAGAETISGIAIDRERDFAIITFASAEVARRIAEQKTINTFDFSFPVSIFDAMDEDHFSSPGADEDAELKLSQSNKVKEPSRTGRMPFWKMAFSYILETISETIPAVMSKQSVTNSAERKDNSVSNTYTADDTTQHVDLRMNYSTHVDDLTKSDSLESLRNKHVDLVKMLGLSHKYPGKISKTELLAIDMAPKTATTSYADLTWALLRAMLVCHCDCRDSIFEDFLKCLNTDSKNCDTKDLFAVSHTDTSISPLDIFHAVLQCCDPLAQSLLFKKMYLCKIAVPFCSRYTTSQKKIVSIWPLMSLPIEFKGVEYTAAQIPTVTISFARIGRPRYSKSEFLNKLLSKQGFNTFFYQECPFGTAERTVSKGNTEVFWLFPEDDDIVRTVFNIRGDLEKDFDETDIQFLSQVTDIIYVVVDLDNITIHVNTILCLIKKFNRVILVINNPIQCRDQQQNVVELLQKKKIEIVYTYKNCQKTPILHLSKTILDIFTRLKKDMKCRPLEERLSDISCIEKDDNTTEFETTKEFAINVIDHFEKEADQNKTKTKVTPAHSIYSKSLGILKRDMYRLQYNEIEEVKTKFKEQMEKQLASITPTVKMFAKTLVKCNANNFIHLQLFIDRVSMVLDLKTKNILSHLMVQNKKEYEELLSLQKQNTTSKTLDRQKEKVKRTRDSIENATFSVIHLFRELMQIYNACLKTNTLGESIGLPKIDKVVDVFVELFIHGYPFEILNGDDNYMPIDWIKTVLGKTYDIIPKEKVFALSILGMQSSGKSTLLNTMFGSQFSVSSGRCTKGVHIQLLRITGTQKQPFNHVLLIDTEGLRAPELQNESFNHDNELATFASGLGDMIILNIMGENIGEIGQTLQIMVHAFLRLKLANKHLDMKKSCAFIYHNVAEDAAPERMNQGFQNIMTTLDKMTKEAALSEGIADIERFDQVIEFDITYSVWYFPNLWQGNPPLARVNEKYSDKARKLRGHLIQTALHTPEKSYKTLQSTVVHINDLWQAVIQEDFVFSFRNTSEIMAYCWLEKRFQDMLWEAERAVICKLQDDASTSFNQCSSSSTLEKCRVDVQRIQVKKLAEIRKSTENEIADLFESNDFKEIINTWKHKTEMKLSSFLEDLKYRCVSEINRLDRKRAIEISTASTCKEHEQKLYDMSKLLGNRIKNQEIRNSEIDSEFEKVWCHFETDLPRQNDTKLCIMKTFEIQMKEMLHKYNTVLKQRIEKIGWPQCYNKKHNNIIPLSKSVSNVGLKDKDLGATLSFTIKTAVEIIYPHLQSLFSDLEKYIECRACIDCEILEQHIKEYLRKIEQWINDMDKKQAQIGVLLKPTFKIKVYLHASSYAVQRFEAQNENFERKQGAAAHFLKYKKHIRHKLDSMINDRSAEDNTAFYFTSVITNFARGEIKHKVTSKVIDQLYKDIPSQKYHLLVEMITDLARTGQFEDWISYLISAKNYAQIWIERKSISHLFGKDRLYSNIAKSEVGLLFADVIQAIHKSLSNETEPMKTDVWIKSFSKCMKAYQIPSDNFIRVILELKEITSKNSKDFSTLLIQNIEESEEDLKLVIERTTAATVNWNTINPYEEILRRIWGCPESCPFCGEPCAKGSKHDDTKHFCIQHRPSGCHGAYNSKTLEICLTSCNYDVQSKLAHTYSILGFKSNKSANKPCKSDRYRDFAKCVHDWDIAPNANMKDTSKIWLWFMAQYKDKLKERYGVVVDNIPASWSEITKEEAIKSYREHIMSNK